MDIVKISFLRRWKGYVNLHVLDGYDYHHQMRAMSKESVFTYKLFAEADTGCCDQMLLLLS